MIWSFFPINSWGIIIVKYARIFWYHLRGGLRLHRWSTFLVERLHAGHQEQLLPAQLAHPWFSDQDQRANIYWSNWKCQDILKTILKGEILHSWEASWRQVLLFYWKSRWKAEPAKAYYKGCESSNGWLGNRGWVCKQRKSRQLEHKGSLQDKGWMWTDLQRCFSKWWLKLLQITTSSLQLLQTALQEINKRKGHSQGYLILLHLTWKSKIPRAGRISHQPCLPRRRRKGSQLRWSQ